MTLEQSRRRREAVGTVHEIVGAMRAIAAGRIQGAQRALAAARDYEAVVRAALGAVAQRTTIRSLPAVDGQPPLLVVLTSEQPLCGAFNQQVLDLTERRHEELRAQGPVTLVAVGLRGARQLAARGLMPDHFEPSATSLQGLRALVKRLSRMIDARYAAGAAGPLLVIHNRYRSVSEQSPIEERLLPLDLAEFSQADRHFAARSPSRAPPGPRHYLPIPQLLAGLVGEFAFIQLFRMAADSFASEQASRLVAMDGATRNTEKMLEQLLDLERRERQGQVTREVLDLIGARFATEA